MGNKFSRQCKRRGKSRQGPFFKSWSSESGMRIEDDSDRFQFHKSHFSLLTMPWPDWVFKFQLDLLCQISPEQSCSALLNNFWRTKSLNSLNHRTWQCFWGRKHKRMNFLQKFLFLSRKSILNSLKNLLFGRLWYFGAGNDLKVSKQCKHQRWGVSTKEKAKDEKCAADNIHNSVCKCPCL